MTDDTTLRIERLIDAPPEAVFAVWTTSASMEEWYADGEDWDARVVENDLRVGGTYHVEWGPKGGPTYVEVGQYLEIDAPNKLVMTETLSNVDNPWTDTKVTVVFEETDGKTLLTLVHEFSKKEHRDAAAGGWPGFIDRVERLVARR